MSSDKQNINKISKEIVSLAASKATVAVPGVNHEKDIKLSKDKEGFVLDIFVEANFGVKIPQLAWDIQNSVKEAVKTTTQQTVKAVKQRAAACHDDSVVQYIAHQLRRCALNDKAYAFDYRRYRLVHCLKHFTRGQCYDLGQSL